MSKADVYLGVIERMEPDITGVDPPGALASIAISLKRIADALERTNRYGEQGIEALSGAITRGLQR